MVKAEKESHSYTQTNYSIVDIKRIKLDNNAIFKSSLTMVSIIRVKRIKLENNAILKYSLTMV
jgi:hypothetical protein